MVQSNTYIKKVAAVLLVAAVLASLGAIASFSAKYAHEQSADKSMASQAFYFTSDVLTSDDGASYSLPVGTTGISFELRNYADDLRWSAGDVGYSWNVAKDDAEVDKGSGSITHEDATSSAETVTVGNLGAGTYKVTATSTSPYAQELSATFVIAAADTNLKTTVEDSAGSPTATLVVSTADYAGNVTVSWPRGVIPDASQDAFKNVTAGADGTVGGSLTVQVSSFSSYSFRFFKTDTSADYGSGSGIGAVVTS